MCGITGFVDKKESLNENDKKELLKKMLDSIKHRGKDGHGITISGSVAIAHARLSILDLSEAGSQPMQNKQGNITLSFNGELYNHLSVRKEIEKKYVFNSHSDTETLLHAYEEFEEKCLNKFKGMFAFSVFDSTADTIFLAVDRFGIKPLYYIDTPEWFAWSSEIKSLLLLPGVKTELNTDALGEHLLFRSIAGMPTLFKDIHKLLPGEFLRYSLDSSLVKKEKYWHLNDQHFAFTEIDHKTDIARLLEASVVEHMLSDVPVGVQLSGGVDSSLIAALVRKNIPDDQELHSFSIGLADEEWNEFPYSRIVAEQLGTKHHEIVFTEEEFCRTLPVATYHFDEPINHSHSIPMLLLAQYAEKYVKVLMSGEGADEVFGGYRRYIDLAKQDPLDADVVMMSSAFAAEAVVRPVIKGELLIDLSYRKALLAELEGCSSCYRIGAYDLATYVTPLLARQDKMGMKSTLENRVPFLDHELVVAGFHLSDAEKILNGEAKYLIKKIASDFLPNEIIYRPKVGFGQLIGAWLKNSDGLGKYLQFFLQPKYRRNFLDYEKIGVLITEHQSGKQDHAAILWILINLEIWMRVFFEGESPEFVWSSLNDQ
jgi:asparagine synthase (glutamine-hydrolysing)